MIGVFINYFKFYFATASVYCFSGASTCNTGLPQIQAGHNEISTIFSIIFAVIGALAILFVVIGGLRYVISEGNPENTTKARNTIIYAIVGLIIALSGEALVAFLIGKL